jgi:uncharacterized protein YjbI with pentapeptide repeats
MKTTIEIIDINNNVLFSLEEENNTLRKTIEEAVRQHANLCRANLCEADLQGVNLQGVILQDVDLSFSNLQGANLQGAILQGAYLQGTNLQDANLQGACLQDSNFKGANLQDANLQGANLQYANLQGSNLRDAELQCVNLQGAELICANLQGAKLQCVNLQGADLQGSDIKNIIYDATTAFLFSNCPSEGSFIGWKKCGNLIVKLRVTENAKRSSATTLKCRCSEAEVIEIQNIDGTKATLTQVCSDYDSKFIYKVGKIVKVTNFDENRWAECSSGIHFFISRDMAVKY